MGWNDPDKKNGNGDDPWGKNSGPPDLDEALKQLQRKVAGLFGGGRNGQFEFKDNKRSSMGMWLIGALILVVYILSGIYIVQPFEEAVVKRFGSYVRTEGPGPHWIPWFIETRTIVNVEEIRTTEHGDQMLTSDENIIFAKMAVQYRINNSRDYLFNIVNPDTTIKQVSESALRSVVGQSTLNEVLTSGRAEVTEKVREQVQTILNSYGSGLLISDLAMQQTRAPEEVKEAFDDAIKAQQDEERFKNEAQAYANQRIPIARGKATRILQEAQAYKEQQILKAKGETARFEQLLPEYKRQPQVMRDRLYLDTLEEVYSHTNKIIVDVDGGNNLMVLPLDQIAKAARNNTNSEEDVTLSNIEIPTQPSRQASSSSRNSIRPSYDDINRYRASRGG